MEKNPSSPESGCDTGDKPLEFEEWVPLSVREARRAWRGAMNFGRMYGSISR
jgi:hypothetical protein